MAVTIIKLGQAPTVVPVKQPQDNYPNSVWLRKNKKAGKAELTGTLYKKIIKDSLVGAGNMREGTVQRRARPLKLLHDRDPAHISKEFQRFAASYGVQAELLPPKSPDLDPLDYGVFGPAQKKLDRELELRQMTWDQQCSFLEGAIKQADTDAAIMALPKRIQLCIAAKGGHFE